MATTAPATNVLAYDVIAVPGTNLLTAGRPVTITWYQDTDALTLDTPRTAVYQVVMGYNTQIARSQREVVVFIATELLADGYSFLPGHVSKLTRPVQGPGTQAADFEFRDPLPNNVTLLQMTENWQYGMYGNVEKFVVYHPKTRTPYAKRFITAAANAPGALNALVVDTKAAVVGSSKDIGATTAISAAMGLSLANSAVSAGLAYLDKSVGKPLETFSPVGAGKPVTQSKL